MHRIHKSNFFYKQQLKIYFMGRENFNGKNYVYQFCGFSICLYFILFYPNPLSPNMIRQYLNIPFPSNTYKLKCENAEINLWYSFSADTLYELLVFLLIIFQVSPINQGLKTNISPILWTKVQISRMICDPIPATYVTQNLEFGQIL